MSDVYYSHDNGGRPFKIELDRLNRRCQVYKALKQENLANDEEYPETPIQTFSFKKVFVGQSPRTKKTEFSGGFGPKFDGNSMILQIKGGKGGEAGEYVFIGDKIFSFHSDEIVMFSSPVGNNDVPYPFATTKSGNTHIFLEGKSLKNLKDLHKVEKILNEFSNGKAEDPYDYYYLLDGKSKLATFKKFWRAEGMKPKEISALVEQSQKILKAGKLKGMKRIIPRGKTQS